MKKVMINVFLQHFLSIPLIISFFLFHLFGFYADLSKVATTYLVDILLQVAFAIFICIGGFGMFILGLLFSITYNLIGIELYKVFIFTIFITFIYELLIKRIIKKHKLYGRTNKAIIKTLIYSSKYLSALLMSCSAISFIAYGDEENFYLLNIFMTLLLFFSYLLLFEGAMSFKKLFINALLLTFVILLMAYLCRGVFNAHFWIIIPYFMVVFFIIGLSLFCIEKNKLKRNELPNS